MTSHRQRTFRPRALLALALAALVVLGLGLPRALVVCTRPCCGGHVKLTTACELVTSSTPAGEARDETGGCACCARHAEDGDRRDRDSDDRDSDDRDRDERNAPGCRGCAHVRLGADLGMPPTGGDVHVDACELERVDLLASLQAQFDAAGCQHPPSTGPPRCDQRTALLATTVLRI